MTICSFVEATPAAVTQRRTLLPLCQEMAYMSDLD